ncbi:MAG: hypothetical protein ACI88H_001560 [Cocleimonas sp.]|jgi:hypothetical protein
MMTNFEFLILGAGRGGTSLLMALLDYHSKLEVISEYESVKYLMGKGLENENHDNTFDSRVNKFIDSCELKAREYPYMKFGNKITTEQLKGLEDHNLINKSHPVNVFDQFFQNYLRNQKKIFILRDGRNCASSKVNRTNQSMEEACNKWNYSVEVYKYLEKDKNSICIKFEDLINSPILTLMMLSKFIGISFEEKMLKGVSNKKLTSDYQNTELVHEKATPRRIDEEHYSSIKENLKYCGYI